MRIGVLAALIVPAVVLACSYSVSRTCSTEDFDRLVSPDGEFSALYQNAVCTDRPALLESRILLTRVTKASSPASESLLVASSPVDPRLSRSTEVRKIWLRWEGARSLLIELSPDLEIERQSEIGSGALETRVVRGGEGAGRTHKLPENAELRRLWRVLESGDKEAITQDAFVILYQNFGRPEMWPIVDALWNLSAAQFPTFNWTLLGDPSIRLRSAGLWGQWSGKVIGRREAEDVAANYARSFLNSEIPAVRMEAITTLGAVGSDLDRTALVSIALSDDKPSALRAVSAIAAIERGNGIRASVLPSLSERASPEVQERIRQLQAAGIVAK